MLRPLRRLRTAEMSAPRAVPTPMRQFKIGTASRLMPRPWRRGPVRALVLTRTIRGFLRRGPS
jgi:hypothetical protein